MTGLLWEFRAGSARVAVHASAENAGRAAAARAALILRDVIAKQGRARLMAATGNSQIPLVAALVQEDIDWQAVELFHMDEYAGMKADHPASFRHWIRTRLEEKVHPRVTHYLHGDAADLPAEIARYTQLLKQAPMDVALVGFGENGHIAFNDPPAADFTDPALVKMVALDEACRRQQFGEGHFSDLAAVPKEALTITCSGLFQAAGWICCVPESRKAAAVRDALEGAIAETCPASLVRRHPNACVYLDTDSASLLARNESACQSTPLQFS